MIDLIKRSTCFLGISAIIYSALMIGLSNITVSGLPVSFHTSDYYRLPGGVTWKTFAEFGRDQKHDVIFIGSSHALRGYDPSVFNRAGISAFNLGSSSQAPMNTYYIIKHYLDSINTGLLIIDAYSGSFRSNSLESTSDLSLNQPDWLTSARMCLALKDIRGLNLLALRTLGPRQPLDGINERGTYKGKGFISNPDSIGATELPAKRWKALSDMQMGYFNKCLELCHELGIPVVIVNHYERSPFRGAYHRRFVSYMNSVVNSANVQYLDFAESEAIEDDNWFEDEDHLNSAGAKIFSQQLVDSLLSLGYLHQQKPSSL